MGQNYKLVLVIGNGFDRDLGLASDYKSFEASSHFKDHLEQLDELKISVNIFKGQTLEQKKELLSHIQLCSIFDMLAAKAELENWFDIERQLAIIAHNRSDIDKNLTYHSSLLDFLPVTRESFIQLHKSLQEYLDLLPVCFTTDKTAFKLFNVIKDHPEFVKVSSFNYTDWNKIFGEQILFPFDYIHGNLKDSSIIIGIQDDLEIDPSYNYMIKSFSENFRSHSLIYDLDDADEVIFFGHSLGDTDYHYFKDFFQRLTVKSSNRDFRLSIFTYDHKSRMDILQQIRNMNDKKTDMLFALCKFNVFMTDPECFDKRRIDQFLYDLRNRLQKKYYL